MISHTTVNEDAMLSVEETISALTEAESAMRYIAKTTCYDPQVARMLAEQWLDHNAAVLELTQKCAAVANPPRLATPTENGRVKPSRRRGYRDLAKGRASIEAGQGASVRSAASA